VGETSLFVVQAHIAIGETWPVASVENAPTVPLCVRVMLFMAFPNLLAAVGLGEVQMTWGKNRDSMRDRKSDGGHQPHDGLSRSGVSLLLPSHGPGRTLLTWLRSVRRRPGLRISLDAVHSISSHLVSSRLCFGRRLILSPDCQLIGTKRTGNDRILFVMDDTILVCKMRPHAGHLGPFLSYFVFRSACDGSSPG
jgi:hypothetical protein